MRYFWSMRGGRNFEKSEINESRSGGEKLKTKEGSLSFLNNQRILLFLLEFLIISAVFLAAWYYIGALYQGAVFFFAQLILLAMGYTPWQISAVNLAGAYLVNFNLVPLAVLAIVTPKLAMRKRCVMLTVGVPLLFSLHVLDLVAHFPMYFYGSGFARMVVYSIGVVGVALPFIIWFYVVYGDLFKPVIKKREEKVKGKK